MAKKAAKKAIKNASKKADTEAAANLPQNLQRYTAQHEVRAVKIRGATRSGGFLTIDTDDDYFHPFDVPVRIAGGSAVKPGDYLVVNEAGEPTILPAFEFETKYKRVP